MKVRALCRLLCWSPCASWDAICCCMPFLHGRIRTAAGGRAGRFLARASRGWSTRGIHSWGAASARVPSVPSFIPEPCGCASLLTCAPNLPLLNLSGSEQFRDRLIGRTSAFEAEYRGSSPRPGTRFFCVIPAWLQPISANITFVAWLQKATASEGGRYNGLARFGQG